MEHRRIFMTIATVLTNQDGIAIAPAFTANGVAGSFKVSASLTSPVPCGRVGLVAFAALRMWPPSY